MYDRRERRRSAHEQPLGTKDVGLARSETIVRGKRKRRRERERERTESVRSIQKTRERQRNVLRKERRGTYRERDAECARLSQKERQNKRDRTV